MNKLNIYTIFGIVFLSSMLLGSGIYSNQIFAEENQTGTENEAEIEADIEQENKCKKDSECKNENEINNLLNITTITQGQQQEEPILPTCEECFLNNADTETQAGSVAETLESILGPENVEINNLQDVCEFIDANQGKDVRVNGGNTEDFNDVLATAINYAGMDEGQYLAIIDCLKEAGFNVDTGVVLP